MAPPKEPKRSKAPAPAPAARAPSDADINRNYEKLTPEEHIRRASMWAGARDVLNYAMMVVAPDFGLELREFECTPCSEKCIDEAVVNAYDEVIRQLRNARGKPTQDVRNGTSSLVRRIDVFAGPGAPSFAPPAENGKARAPPADAPFWFAVRNDGPGMPVIERTLDDGARLWLPEMLVSHALSGSNFRKGEPGDGAPPMTITGGCNGVGIKIANINSHEFYVDIRYVRPEGRGLAARTYRQRFSDHMYARDPPTVRDLPAAEAALLTPQDGHTEVGFRLDLEGTGWPAGAPAAREVLTTFARTRATHLAAFLGGFGVRVFFNGREVPVHRPDELLPRAVRDAPEVVRARLGDAFPWEVCLVPAARHPLGAGSLSVLNGLAVAGGSHVAELLRQLAALVKARLPGDRRFGATQLAPLVFVQVVGYVQHAQWDGQRKDRLTISDAKLRDYQLPDSPAVRALAQSLADGILAAEARKDPPKKSDRALVKEARGKYFPASRAGTREAHRCVLFLGEGDSAISNIRAGIQAEWERLQPAGAPRKKCGAGGSSDFSGVFSLGGVIMNARKESREHGRARAADAADAADDADDADAASAAGSDLAATFVRSEKLRENGTLCRLVQTLGLKFSETYDESAAGEAAFAGLRYGRVIVLTDQDFDGHNIAGLVLNFFHRFWPALIRRQFVSRLPTPVVRAFPRARGKRPPRTGGKAPAGDVREFFSEAEFRAWFRGEPPGKYEVLYYKGLGGWTPEDFGGPMRDFLARAFRFELDRRATESFETFYGTETGLRKLALGSPPLAPAPAEEQRMHADRLMPCSTLLHRDAKSYQLDNLKRKLPGELDGMYESSRKALFALRRIYRTPGATKMRKIADLQGLVAPLSHYHHGEQSMYGVLFRMGQRFPGRNLPLLYAEGNFGTRWKYGRDHVSARYAHARLNVELADALFPRADDHLLRYTESDGEMAEPVSFVPTLPLALLDSLALPATGWRVEKWAVRLEDVAHNLRLMLEEPSLAPDRLRRFRIELAQFAGVQHLAYKKKAGAPEEDPAQDPEAAGVELLVGAYELDAAGGRLVITDLPPSVATETVYKRLLDLPEVADVGQGPPNVVELAVAFNRGVDLAELEAKHKRPAYPRVSGLAWYLGIVLYVHHALNMMGVDGAVRPFASYEALFARWFEARRELYARRLDRERVLLEIELLILREELRYARELSKMKLERRAKREMEAELDRKKYLRVHHAAFQRPGGIATEELRAVILERGHGADAGEANEAGEAGDDADEAGEAALAEFEIPRGAPNFDYLLKKSMLGMTDASVARLEAAAAAVEAAIAANAADTHPFRGARTWRAEADHALEIIKRGRASNWLSR